jgi:hypothetical protein
MPSLAQCRASRTWARRQVGNLNQVERLQRMRLGQPVLRPVKVELST